MTSNTRVLIVGMADSIHLARWISQFDESKYQFEIVSSSPHRRIHESIRLRVDDMQRVTFHWFSRKFSLPMWALDRILSDWLRGAFIAWRILKFRPDIVHVHEIQNAGYATRRAYQLNWSKKPKLIVTNYGSEIVWFSRFPSHLKRIRSLLAIADAFSAECTRDYLLAREIHPNIQQLALMPVAGGLSNFNGVETARTKITLKGYENKWGKALFALKAIIDIADELGSLEIVLYSCNSKVLREVRKITKSSRISITTYRKGSLSHSELLSIFQESLIYVGHSLSDGISTSMLEAMAMGSIPIQTRTSCADEWIESSKTGFLVDPFDHEAIQKAVLSVVTGKFDVDSARAKNYETIEEKYDPTKLRKVASGYYEGLKQ